MKKNRCSNMREFSAAGLAVLLLGFVILNGAPAPRKQPYTTWSEYSGSADSMQYSALKQINKSNVGQMELAWFYPAPTKNYGRFAFNPLIVDNIMYVGGRDVSTVAALDAAMKAGAEDGA